MANEVIQYDSNAAIGTTPVLVLDFPTQEYNMLRVYNEDALDLNIFFSDGDGVGAKYVAKTGDNLLQGFKCTGKVSLSVDSGTTSANIFIH